MKKVDTGYIVKLGGLWLTLLTILLVLLFFTPDLKTRYNNLIQTAIFFLFIYILLKAPGYFLESNLNKKAALHEQALKQQGFVINYRFDSSNGVYFFDTVNGQLAVVYKYNPEKLQFINGTSIDNICTKTGKILFGTSLVSCQFTVDGHKQTIYTLKVYRGQFSMHSPEVLDAISKADLLCEKLTAIKNK